jgi:hypothetical protein
MIPPPFKHRFIGDSGIDIATQEIDAVFPDGEKIRVILRLGAPFPKDGFTCIRTELENLDRTDGPISGEGTLHALIMGISFIIARLEIYEQKHGCKYFWPDSEDLFDYRTTLMTEGLRK